tara:strand:+ start:413 stop:1051 length:639 start_codon:yes stop_codon:yes gene_type:complete
LNILLKNIAPNFLIRSFLSSGEIWGLNIEFNHGDFIQVKAPSGAGKSTLMGILYGIRKDFKGDLCFDGSIVTSQINWSKLRTNKISIVFQELELLKDLTVFDNIQLKNQLTRFKTDEEIIIMLKSLNILNLKDKRVGLLSRGEKQRVAIIRALTMPFKWLLLDEPFSALDNLNTTHAIELIKGELLKQKASLILTNLFEDDYFHYTSKFKMA